MAFIIHADKVNKNANKALITAEYVGVEIKFAEIFEMFVSNRTPEFLKMNPYGKIPVPETPDGPLFESNAIARYVARLKTDTSLFGSSLIEYGQVEQWIDFASLEIDSNMVRWFRPRFGYDNYNAPAEELAIANLKRAIGVLNTYLASHDFLVGESVTLADIITTCNLYLGFKYLMTKTFTSEYPHIERYFWTMVDQPNFSKVLPKTKQRDVVPPVLYEKYPTQPKEDGPKKEENKESVKVEAS